MCCSKGLIKRVLPFFLTFAVGLFIASFFVTVAAPSLRLPVRGERRRHQESDQMREVEIQRLNEKINQLEMEKSDREAYIDAVVPPQVLAPPTAPLNHNRR